MEWVSVKDRLPEDKTNVLMRISVLQKFNVCEGCYVGSGEWVDCWCSKTGKGTGYEVLHWMPLSPPPEVQP